MSTTDSIEITAASVEQAISEALGQLAAQEQDVVIEVLATPRAGVLGLGARQARVRVTRRPPMAATSGVTSPPPAPPRRSPPQARPTGAHAPGGPREERPRRGARERVAPEPPAPRRPEPVAEPPAAQERAAHIEGEEPARRERDRAEIDAQVKEAREVLVQILELMGEKAEVKPLASDSESLELEIKGDGSGILIGRHGQTLDALEYVVNRVVARRIRDALPVMLETEAYRARRRQQLHRMALSMGERAKRDHEPVRLEPMPPRDRRVVHLALKDDPMITTRSAGEGFLRSVEIVPVEGRRGGGGGGGGGGEGRGRRGRGGRGGGGEGSQQPEPGVGEQGGFKRGQKRIV
jgi:spoIIIJ-associated protein